MDFGKPFKKVYSVTNNVLVTGMYSCGKHLPSPVLDVVDSEAGLYVSLALLLSGMFFPPMYYVGVGAVIAQNTCRVINERKESLEEKL